MEDLMNYGSYEQYKNAVDTVLNRTVEDFVITGYLLKKGRDTDILKDSGYANVNEFAETEYHLDTTQVSRYIRINDKFSVGGYSDCLQEQYKGFGYAKLALMLTLPDSINEELSPSYSKSEIQAVKEEIESEKGISDIEIILEDEKESQKELNNLQKGLNQLLNDEPELFVKLYENAKKEEYKLEDIQEILAPDGEKLYSIRIQGYGRIMLFLNDSDKRITVHKVRENEKEYFTWEDIDGYIKEVLTDQTAKERWEELYGREFPEKKQEIAPVQQKTEEKKVKPRKESKVKKAATQEKSIPKKEETAETLNATPNLETEKEGEIPGQMEITKDMPEYCPLDLNPPEQIEETGQQETEEARDCELAEMQTGEEKSAYGSRKQYLDTLTEYGAALYLAASMKEMKHMLLNDVTYWETWLKAEVDENGEEIELVE